MGHSCCFRHSPSCPGGSIRQTRRVEVPSVDQLPSKNTARIKILVCQTEMTNCEPNTVLVGHQQGLVRQHIT